MKIFHSLLIHNCLFSYQLSSRMAANNKISGTSKIDDEEETKLELASSSTEEDILGLKKSIKAIKKYLDDLEKEKKLARKLLEEEYLEGLMRKTEIQLDQLERLVYELEFAQVQKQVLEGLKNGNAALEKANAVLDEIEDMEVD